MPLDLFPNEIAEGDARAARESAPALPSGFTDNFLASWHAGRMFSLSNAAINVRKSVIEDLYDEAQRKTGQDLTRNIQFNPETGEAIDPLTTLNTELMRLHQPTYDDAEVERRAVEKSRGAVDELATLQGRERTFGGKFGGMLGSLAAGATDPMNLLAAPAVAPEAMGVLGAVLAGAAGGALVQMGTESVSPEFRERVQPGYAEDAPERMGEAILGGAVLAGGTHALASAWRGIKGRTVPRIVRDAGNVVEGEDQINASNPFTGVAGEVAHREALTTATDQIARGDPVNITLPPEVAAQSRALFDRLDQETGFTLPAQFDERQFQLLAEEAQLKDRYGLLDSELQGIPPGDREAQNQLDRLRGIEMDLREATTAAERRAAGEKRDELLAATTPEQLRAAAAPLEIRRKLEGERTAIEARLDDIARERGQIRLESQAPIGQRQVVPRGPPPPEYPLSTAIGLRRGLFTERMGAPTAVQPPVAAPTMAPAAVRVPTRSEAAQRLADQIDQTLMKEGVKPIGEELRGAARPVGFTTAKGSTYELHDDGTTTRTKAARADVGHEGDEGLKERSAKTIYVDQAVASNLSGAGLSDVGGKGFRLALKDGKATLLSWNQAADRWGAAPGARDIPFTTEPEVGKSPVEAWKPATDVPGFEAYRGQHAGNAITQLHMPEPARGAAPVSDIRPDPSEISQSLAEATRPANLEKTLFSPEMTQAQIADLERLTVSDRPVMYPDKDGDNIIERSLDAELHKVKLDMEAADQLEACSKPVEETGDAAAGSTSAPAPGLSSREQAHLPGHGNDGGRGPGLKWGE